MSRYFRLVLPLLPLALAMAISMPALFAQSWMSRTEIGFTAGGMNYIGDLNNQSVFGKVNVAAGGLLRYNFDERWSMRGDIDYGHVEGGNPDYIERRNLSFYSHIVEASLRVEFNFFPFSMRDDHFVWTPFIFGGIGFFAYNPKAQYTDPNTGETQWYELQPLTTEGQGTPLNPTNTPYNLMQLNMPFGIGVKYHPSKSLTLCAEYGFRKTWTDDVSTLYVDNTALKEYAGDVAAALADRSSQVEPGYVNVAGVQRGDDSLDDWYAYFNVSLTLKFDFLFGWMLKRKCDNK